MRVFTASAIPFVGFGFLDNLIMILAGDYIDAKLGAAFAISTMAAAGVAHTLFSSVPLPVHFQHVQEHVVLHMLSWQPVEA